MKRQITRSLASLALATALLSGAGSAFAATPASVTPTFNALGDPTTPALPGLPGELPGLGSLPDPSALPNLGAPGDLPVDFGTLGLPTDPAAGAQIATGALELTGGALDAGAGVTSAVTFCYTCAVNFYPL
jgi:hypothetical protein